MLKTITLAILVIISYCRNPSKDYPQIEELSRLFENFLKLQQIKQEQSKVELISDLLPLAVEDMKSILKAVNKIETMYDRSLDYSYLAPEQNYMPKPKEIPKETNQKQKLESILSKIQTTIKISQEITKIHTNLIYLEREIHQLLQPEIIYLSNDMLESSSSDEEETNHPVYPTRGGNSTKIFLTAGQSTEREKKSSIGQKNPVINKSFTGRKKRKAIIDRKK